jgi:hypothetical protein
VTVVYLLLEKGAKVNGQGEQLDNALQAGHEAIARLLEKGADFNAKGGFQDNALLIVSTWVGGSEVFVRLLLEKAAEINRQGGKYGKALQVNGMRDSCVCCWRRGEKSTNKWNFAVMTLVPKSVAEEKSGETFIICRSIKMMRPRNSDQECGVLTIGPPKHPSHERVVNGSFVDGD